MIKQIICYRPLQILTSLHLQTFISSLVLMVDYGGKWCHSSFKGICGPKANNWGRRLSFFVTALFIGEEWLSLFTLINPGLSRQFWFEMLLKESSRK